MRTHGHSSGWCTSLLVVYVDFDVQRSGVIVVVAATAHVVVVVVVFVVVVYVVVVVVVASTLAFT